MARAGSIRYRLAGPDTCLSEAACRAGKILVPFAAGLAEADLAREGFISDLLSFDVRRSKGAEIALQCTGPDRSGREV